MGQKENGPVRLADRIRTTVHLRRGLFRACVDTKNPNAGLRDACAFALVFEAGLRRTEVVALLERDWQPMSDEVVFCRNGRWRTRSVNADIKLHLHQWLAAKKSALGEDDTRPLLCPVKKSGDIIGDRKITTRALYKRLVVRAKAL